MLGRQPPAAPVGLERRFPVAALPQRGSFQRPGGVELQVEPRGEGGGEAAELLERLAIAPLPDQQPGQLLTRLRAAGDEALAQDGLRLRRPPVLPQRGGQEEPHAGSGHPRFQRAAQQRLRALVAPRQHPGAPDPERRLGSRLRIGHFSRQRLGLVEISRLEPPVDGFQEPGGLESRRWGGQRLR